MNRVAFLPSIIAIFWILFLGSFQWVVAQEITVKPLLIDQDIKARDLFTENITIENNTATKLVLYATVNEIALDTTGEIREFISPVETDRTSTVTSWIEITRGRIEIEPGASTIIPLTIRVHPYAEPGDYYAYVGFVPASKRDGAQAQVLLGNADGVILTLSLQDNLSESLRISSFNTDRFITKHSDRIINIELENNGQKDTVPQGEVIFYNSRGEEFSAELINKDNVPIAPGETISLQVTIPFEGGFGRFKANLVLTYGDKQKASVFDTTQFFMFPFEYIVLALVLILSLSILVTYIIRRTLVNDTVEDGEVPLHVRTDREHTAKDHDINLQK